MMSENDNYERGFREGIYEAAAFARKHAENGTENGKSTDYYTAHNLLAWFALKLSERGDALRPDRKISGG